MLMGFIETHEREIDASIKHTWNLNSIAINMPVMWTMPYSKWLEKVGTFSLLCKSESCYYGFQKN